MTVTERQDILFDLLKDCKKSKKFEDDYYKIPLTVFKLNEENVILFNKIASWLYSSGFSLIERTKKGSIKQSDLKTTRYDIKEKKLGLEIVIISYYYGCFKLRWSIVSKELFDEDNKRLKINGRVAFYKFKQICEDFGIDLEKYAQNVPELAKETKNSIEKAMICFRNQKTEELMLYGKDGNPKTLKNMFHIDFHSSYMSGLVNTHPEFREVVEYIYSKRKEDDGYYKAILNMTQGYMQSDLCELRWAHLSKDMIADNNRRIRQLTNMLEASNFFPILYNTDGIWYFSPTGEPFHGYGEGKGIGHWENDHMNCIFRAKSVGCYEYIENKKYHVVCRGLTNYDKIQPNRDKWKWGDIFRKESTYIVFEFKNGYLYMDGKLEGADYEEKID